MKTFVKKYNYLFLMIHNYSEYELHLMFNITFTVTFFLNKAIVIVLKVGLLVPCTKHGTQFLC